MCSRYYYDETTERAVRRIADQAERGLNLETYGDIHPTDRAVIIAGEGEKLYATGMRWGFQGFEKQLLFNARAESVLDKISFRDSVLHRRCVIPAGGFYEWNRSKEKVTFTGLEKSPVYMAGCYRKYGNQLHFVVITTGANDNMRPVHDRMPLILQEGQLRDWICKDEEAKHILQMPSPMLERYEEYEQLSLF